MARRFPNGDPLLKTPQHKANVAYWRRRVKEGVPCARCGLPINHVLRAPNQLALVCGHIVSRDEARSMGWTDVQINSRSNTQPEHLKCSSKSGAEYANEKMAVARAAQSSQQNSAPAIDTGQGRDANGWRVPMTTRQWDTEGSTDVT